MVEIRKLVAILAADVVGYSKLAGTDEDRTLARLRALRSDLIDPTIAVHNGRTVKRTGDGSIVEFRSVVDAVRCAVEVQNGMVERNAGLSPERRIDFRIGIHVGDVVEESDGDLMGDGVNIAARLEGIAAVGAICLSEDAYRQVKARLDLKVRDRGPIQLKNIVEPVRVYSLEVDQPAQATAGTPARSAERTSSVVSKPYSVSAWLATALAAFLLLATASAWFLIAGRSVKTFGPAHLSIVVLPFTNLSGDQSQDYFADGVTENLTTELSRIRDSFVIARNTAFTYKGKSVNTREIGRDLGVRYVLEGSVQRDQGRVRVNAQLIDAESGGHLWADRFDKPLTDLFSMQDEIVASLASQLGAELITHEARRAERMPAPDSMDLYFQGMAWYNRGRNNDDLSRARGFLERALALDPTNLEAALAMAAVDVQVAVSYSIDDRSERLRSVEANLNRVLSESPNNAWAHYLIGRVLVQTNRQEQSISRVRAGVGVKPELCSSPCTNRFRQAS